MKMTKKIAVCLSLVIGVTGMAMAEQKNQIDCEACNNLETARWSIVANKHFKICDNGHAQQLSDHVFDEYGECVCGVVDEYYAERISKTCKECGVELTKNWKEVGGNLHYQECANGHRNDLGVHEWTHDDLSIRVDQNIWEDNQCKICKKIIPAYPPASYLVENKILNCLACGLEIGAKWYETDAGVHYRACPNNHHSFIGEHYFYDGKCLACKIDESIATKPKRPDTNEQNIVKDDKKNEDTEKENDKEQTNNENTNEGVTDKEKIDTVEPTEQNFESDLVNSTTLCKTCGAGLVWKKTETMHVAYCTKNQTHVELIEGHLFENGSCTKCGYSDTKNYKSIFGDFTSENHWGWRHVCSMADKGIVKGTPIYNELSEVVGFNLYADENITAEAFISLVARILGYDGNDTISRDEVYMPISSEWSEGEWKFVMKYLGDKGRSIMQVVLSNGSSLASEIEMKTNYKNPITRERAAYLIGELFNSSTYIQYRENAASSVQKFEDWDKVTAYCKTSLSLLAYCDILRGNLVDGKLYVDPQVNLTRVQAIAFLDRYYSVKDLGI